MAKGIKVSALDLVVQAIYEAGTSDPGKVSLKIEEIVKKKMSGRATPKYRSAYYVFLELARYGIEKYSDVARLVDRVKRTV